MGLLLFTHKYAIVRFQVSLENSARAMRISIATLVETAKLDRDSTQILCPKTGVQSAASNGELKRRYSKIQRAAGIRNEPYG